MWGPCPLMLGRECQLCRVNPVEDERPFVIEAPVHTMASFFVYAVVPANPSDGCQLNSVCRWSERWFASAEFGTCERNSGEGRTLERTAPRPCRAHH